MKPAMAVHVGGLPERPFHDHDCESCEWLMSRDNVDLYFCPQNGAGLGTVVARYSSDGPNYTSGVHFAHMNQWIALAYNCSKMLGLLDAKTIASVERRWIS